jgi:uncharacterized protein YjbI with pentapeptide repeats
LKSISKKILKQKEIAVLIISYVFRFSNTKFRNADFSGARLSHANLSSADLTGSQMVNVRTDGVMVDENTKTHDIKLLPDMPQLPADEKISKTKSALQGIDERFRRLILRDNPALHMIYPSN